MVVIRLAKLVKSFSKTVDGVVFSICRAQVFYDVVAECSDIDSLEKVKKLCNSDSDVIRDGVFGSPIVVLDTCDSYDDAFHIFTVIIEKYLKDSMKKGEIG